MTRGNGDAEPPPPPRKGDYRRGPQALRAAAETTASFCAGVISPSATNPSVAFATHDTYAPWLFHALPHGQI